MSLLTNKQLKTHRTVQLPMINAPTNAIDGGGTANTTDLLNQMNTHCLIPLVSKPTRITDETATLIDNIFISCSNNCTAGVLISDISDHLPVFLLDVGVFESVDCGNSASIEISYRLINEISVSKLCEELMNFDYGEIFVNDHVNVIFEQFNDVVLRLFQACCPVKTKTISGRSLSKPWINGTIKSEIKKRQKLYLLHRMNKVSRLTYSRYSNFVTLSIRKAKRNYFHAKFLTYKNDVTNTWKSINAVLARRYERSGEASALTVDGTKYTDPAMISRLFNSYFSSIGGVISRSVSSSASGSFSDFLGNRLPHSFVYTPVSFLDIDFAIQSLKNKRSNINVIPNHVLKKISFIISPILARIVNLSVTSGLFPKLLKIARVVPIFKGGNKEARY